jgi:hypothetical protein
MDLYQPGFMTMILILNLSQNEDTSSKVLLSCME